MNTTKASLRAGFLEMRKNMPASKKAAADKHICANLLSLDEIKNASTVLAYAPFRGEIDLVPVFYELSSSGKRVGFPKCMPEHRMIFRECGYGELVQQKYGILEPTESAPEISAFSDSDVCIIPCLAISGEGHRLGYGGGYYDRFLASFPGKKIVAVYNDFITNEVFNEEFDIPAEIILTEEGVIRV